MKSAKLLVVDDDPRYLDLLEFMLESAGYEVIKVQEPKQAQALAIQEQPDLVITDVAMPELDGVALGVDLRANEATAEIPVLYVSALGAAELHDGVSIGRGAYLSKPFTPTELIDAIQNVLRESSTKGAHS